MDFFLFELLSAAQKTHILFNETKVFAVNWFKLHYKLQHLFCGALYKPSKCKKRAVPFKKCFDALKENKSFLPL
jgi:hypothetical protein